MPYRRSGEMVEQILARVVRGGGIAGSCVGVTEMAVRIDEGRHHGLPREIDDRSAGWPRTDLASHLRDTCALDDERGVLDAGRPSPAIRRAPSKSTGPVPVPGVCASTGNRPTPGRSSAHVRRVIIPFHKDLEELHEDHEGLEVHELEPKDMRIFVIAQSP